MARVRIKSDQPVHRGARAPRRPDYPRHTPLASRVSWLPLAAMIDLSGRSPLHSGRPAVEQVPCLDVRPLRRQGAEAGVVLELKADDGPIEVTLMARARFAENGGELRLAWEATPEIGQPVVHTLALKLHGIATPLETGRHSVTCPHCELTRYKLYWAVTTWACRYCLGLRHENLRLGYKYSLEKQAKAIRAKLGLNPTPLSPIAVTNRCYLPLAERLWQMELELVAHAAGGRR